MGKVIKGSFPIAGEASASAFAIELETDAMTLGGLLPGDILVCEPENVMPPKHGNAVVYLDNETVSSAKYYPPFLMPSSSNEEHKPVQLERDGIKMIGTIVYQVRYLV